MEIGWELLMVLFFVACVAGWVDTIAGGGGLLTMPALLLAGVPPAATIATNKMQGCGSTFMSTLYFLRQGTIDFKTIKWAVMMAFFGSLFGGWLVLKMPVDDLILILPVLLIAIGLYFLLSPKIDNVDKKARIGIFAFSFTAAPLLGFYDGFFGPGTGSLMALAFIALCGYGASKATAHAKILNFTSSMTGLGYFILFGQIAWVAGLVMICGQALGAFIAARMVLEKGAKLIKPVVVTVCFVMACQILFKNLGG